MQRLRQHGIDGTGRWPEVERLLNDWFLQRREHGLPIAGSNLMFQGERFFNIWWHDLPEEQREHWMELHPHLIPFSASSGWLQGFLTRHGISYRKTCKDSTSIPLNAAELVTAFQNEVRNIINDNGIQIIVNMDETFVLWDIAPTYTYSLKGLKQVDIRTSRGNAKLGCTVTLAMTACGRKLPASIIFKGLRDDGPEIARLRATAPNGVRVTGSQTGWASWQTLIAWVNDCLIPFVGDNFPFLLIWDMFPAHRHQQVRDHVEDTPGFIGLIPGRCTSLVQPLDLTIIRSFKCTMRRLWKEWKIENNDIHGRSPQITRDAVIQMVSTAWERIAPEAINTAW
ncbi:tigger transposable element-derived protein 2-like [Lineus longissimus]|uniref:tigger transposable element-derived protein 2-like n=1 Tax=Lineus longissimus TaxID=88925 RepID=UPI00315DACC2